MQTQLNDSAALEDKKVIIGVYSVGLPKKSRDRRKVSGRPINKGASDGCCRKLWVVCTSGI